MQLPATRPQEVDADKVLEDFQLRSFALLRRRFVSDFGLLVAPSEAVVYAFEAISGWLDVAADFIW